MCDLILKEFLKNIRRIDFVDQNHKFTYRLSFVTVTIYELGRDLEYIQEFHI